MRIELQSFIFNRFMASRANAVPRGQATAERLINLPHFLMVPARQAVEKPKPILIGTIVHPLSILFDFVSFPLQVL
jgi:hypothetical protein